VVMPGPVDRRRVLAREFRPDSLRLVGPVAAR